MKNLLKYCDLWLAKSSRFTMLLKIEFIIIKRKDRWSRPLKGYRQIVTLISVDKFNYAFLRREHTIYGLEKDLILLGLYFYDFICIFHRNQVYGQPQSSYNIINKCHYENEHVYSQLQLNVATWYSGMQL